MDKKNEILQAMFVLFSQKGYQASIADLAKQVNLKPSSIYSHFGSKDEIVFLTVEQEVNEFFGCMETAGQKSDSPEKTLYNLLQAVLDYFKDHNRLRFWKSIVLIQQVELRKQCQILIRQREQAHIHFVEGLFETMILEGNLSQNCKKGALSLYLCLGNGLLDIMLANQEESFDFESFAEDSWQFYQMAIR
ncbi:TetR/AcrR family transcriptional regulator [Anoxynatronum sibiricum]|uniref:TetR/AcrR family transcriptional regulator n=1 Tax=Anoxynatronum sibiricum TaxID=210623 RepID=A0ABU9VYC3_9CLOT